jgi:hypothetical protein
VEGRGGVLRDCAVEFEFDVVTRFIPAKKSCDEWVFRFDTSSQNPAFAMDKQLLFGKYARTWKEFPNGPNGPVIQVWRFLVNGDLTYSFPPVDPEGVAPPGVVPLSALPPYDLPVHFVGNVDYARNCITGEWEVAYTLTHFCPLEMHGPGSQQPLPVSTWPKRTYHFVGPRNFTFSDGAVPTGITVGQSWRNSTGYITNPGTRYKCFTKGKSFMIVPNLLTSFAECACTDAPSTVWRYKHQTLFFVQQCGTGTTYFSNDVTLIPTGLSWIPTGLRAYVLGTWGPIIGGTYPGPKTVSAYLGAMSAPPLCPSPQQPSANLVTGIGTTGGYQVEIFAVSQNIAVLGSLDLQNMLVPTASGYAMGFGAAFVSERVWSLITPDAGP